jgi:hypothetical protein
MSESANLAGGKVTYLDGHIANTGNRTVTGVTVQVVFRDYANEVAQSERMPLMLIRMREPYIDTEMVSAAPLKPGAEQDFRLNFDRLQPGWAGIRCRSVRNSAGDARNSRFRSSRVLVLRSLSQSLARTLQTSQSEQA